ncbi:hypothetical protein RB11674 [Rhodopirellula baltica SH 1]|uniref:Uncharacterized protein n=1 Tax=Rhodopirellula baltica (strain DSM 10527 / NCIMB 13988 / SH1) TaxID=243090 RepID=Q7UE00_RHOBA|nr:hypothetical protein RB11674 [Rhodopirellula baltica SH 1]
MPIQLDELIFRRNSIFEMIERSEDRFVFSVFKDVSCGQYFYSAWPSVGLSWLDGSPSSVMATRHGSKSTRRKFAAMHVPRSIAVETFWTSVNVNRPLSRLPNKAVILLKAKLAIIQVLRQRIRTLGHPRAVSRYRGLGTTLPTTAHLITINRRHTTITLPHSPTRVMATKVVTTRTRISHQVTTHNHKPLNRIGGTRLRRLGLLNIVELIERLRLDAVTRVARYGQLGMLSYVCHVTHP